MAENSIYTNQCDGCFFRAEMGGIQDMVTEVMLSATSDTGPGETTDEERSLGKLGRLVDFLSETSECDGPKISLSIGRVSLVQVCGYYWDNVSKISAVVFGVRPKILK